MKSSLTKLRRPSLTKGSPIFLALLGSLAFASAAWAYDVTVTNTADSGPGSLRQALVDVPASGSIGFNIPTTDAGYNATTGMTTIALAAHDDLVINSSVTITGPGAGALTIDGGSHSRIFKINGGTVIISGLAMANAALDTTYSGDYLGTAIDIADGAALTLNNAAVTGVTGHYGQAIFGNNVTITINNSVISNNRSDGVDCNGAITITNSTISGNRGYGVGSGGATAVITGCTISGNQYGGIASTGTLTVTDTTLTGNLVYGGVYFYGSSATISNCTIVGNSEAQSFYLPSGNTGGGGGGILNLIYTYYGGTFTVSNSIIAGNTSSASATAQDVFTPFQPITSGGYNLVGQTDGTEGFTANGDMTGTNAAPLDPKLGPLQNNGGPTQTLMPLTGSPVINAGNPNFNPATLPYDQRGYQRVAGGRLDIGAVESGSYINMPPVAVAGNPQSIHDATKVTLNGSASYDDNTPSASLGYAWQFVSVPTGSKAVLTGANTVSPSFTPDLVGNYQVQLVVTDTGYPPLSSAPSTVLISSYNQAPVAKASVSSPLTIIGQAETLSSAGSMDPDGDAITYKWTITSAPAGSKAIIANATSATASLVPDKAGTYTVTVTPSDFLGAGTPASASFVADTSSGYVHDLLADAIARVQALTPSQVTSAGNKADFLLLLQLASAGAQQNCPIGNLLAIAEIDLATIRTDGVPLRGSVDTGALNRDWILDAATQKAVYADLVNARAVLASQPGCH